MTWTDRWKMGRGRRERSPEESDPELEQLLSRSRSLPRSARPERDLWSGIENRISGDVSSRPESRWSLASVFPRPLAASVLALTLVATTAISVLVLSGVLSGGLPGMLDAAPSEVEMAAIAKGIRERDGVAQVHQSLVAILEANRAQLPPETVAVLDENLRSIDRAIAEIHLALESNPNHHALSFLLAEAYRSEAELLERLEWWLETPEGVTS